MANIDFTNISRNSINYIGQLLETNGKLSTLEETTTEFSLENKTYFCWLQLVNVFPRSWKKKIQDGENLTNLCVYDDHPVETVNYMRLINFIARNYI